MLLTTLADAPSWSALRDATKRNFVVPRTCLKLGERAFSVAAPQALNRLPMEIKSLCSSPLFKRDMKTFLLWVAFNVRRWCGALSKAVAKSSTKHPDHLLH